MPEPHHDPVPAAFDAFRATHTGRYRPIGLPSVIATVRRRQRARRVTGAVLAVVALVVPAAPLLRTHDARTPGRTTIRTAPPPSGSTAAAANPHGSGAASRSPGGGPTSAGRLGSGSPTHFQPPASGADAPRRSVGAPDNGNPPTSVEGCVAGQLAASRTDGGSVASQPFVTVSLRNNSGSTCRLAGYPGLSATGYPATDPGSDRSLEVAVHDGSLYERADPGPQGVELAPGKAASFSLGTVTAYDDRYGITSVRISVPGGGALALGLTIAASAPSGSPIPLSVTGFAADPP